MCVFSPFENRRAVATAALLLPFFFALHAGANDDFWSQRSRLDARFRSQLYWLAAKCDELGLHEQAAATRDWFIPRDPNRQYIFLPPADDPIKPADEAEQLVRYWHQKLTDFRHAQGDALFALAKSELDADRPTRAYQLLHEVLRENPDHEAARAILGYRRVDGVWRKPAGVIRTRSMRVPNAELGFAAGSWWLIESENFSISTNLNEQAGVELVERLEELYDVWQQLFFRYWSNRAALARRFDGATSVSRSIDRHKVILFRDREQYLARLQPIEPLIEVTVGIYLEPKRAAYFYGGSSPDIWYHEVTHQLFSETGRVRPGVGDDRDFWLVEGIALYMESMQRWDGFFTVGGTDAERLQYARYRALSEGFYLPLHELATLGRRELQQHSDIRRLYSQAAGLSHFLMDHDRGVYRGGVAEYLDMLYHDPNRSRDMQQLLGRPVEDLDRQYIQFLRVTDDDLAHLVAMPTATSLALGNTGVTDAGLQHVQKHQRLQWLDLTATAVTDRGVASLADCTAMNHLNLERTRVTDACLPTIAAFDQLEILDLTACQITDDGLEHIAALENLRELWLGQTQVTDAGLVHLTSLKKLELLDVNGTRVTREGVNRLKQQLPNLKDE